MNIRGNFTSTSLGKAAIKISQIARAADTSLTVLVSCSSTAPSVHFQSLSKGMLSTHVIHPFDGLGRTMEVLEESSGRREPSPEEVEQPPEHQAAALESQQ